MYILLCCQLSDFIVEFYLDFSSHHSFQCTPLPRPYPTHSHRHTGPLVIVLHLVCERLLSPQTFAKGPELGLSKVGHLCDALIVDA
jgi:hypothetical protein